ncbi:MAG: potassium channel family protein [Ignavibacteriales bacterium]
MHVIICGSGNVTIKVLEEFLKIKEDIVLITSEVKKQDEKFIKANNIKVIIGDARSDEVLIEAGTDSAKAMIVIMKDEVTSVEISLKAKEINPNILITVRMFDEFLADKITAGFGIDKVLCTPALASLGFVSAVLSDKICEYIKFDKKNLFLYKSTINKKSLLLNKTVRECRNELRIEPVYIEKEEKNVSILSDDDYRFNLGDKVLLFSTNIDFLKEKKEDMLSIEKKTSLIGVLVDNFQEAFFKVTHAIKKVPNAIKLLILIFSLFILVSVWVFHKTQNWSIIDSLYFVIATCATVGYGDFNLKDAAPWVKFFDCMVILSGAALIGCFFSLLAEMVLNNKFEQYFGINKTKLRNHIIVAGMGRLGYRIADSLNAIGEKVIVIEKKTESEKLAVMKRKMPVIIGDARDIKVLKRVAIERAKALVAVTDDDLVNLGIALHAKDIKRSIRTVIRVVDTDFGRRIKNNYNVDRVLSSSQLIASTFTVGLIDIDVIKSFWWQGMHMVILKKRINKDSEIRMMTKKEVIKKYKIIPLIVKNKSGYRHIDDGHTFTDGEVVILISEYHNIKGLKERGHEILQPEESFSLHS